MVTPAIKDKFLSYLIAQEKVNINIDFHDLYVQEGISDDITSMILRHFEKLGLISCKNYMNGCIVKLNVEIYDFFNHGGFVAQEELLRANLEKLNLELFKLSKDIEPSKLETINTITSIANSISAALVLFK